MKLFKSMIPARIAVMAAPVSSAVAAKDALKSSYTICFLMSLFNYQEFLCNAVMLLLAEVAMKNPASVAFFRSTKILSWSMLGETQTAHSNSS